MDLPRSRAVVVFRWLLAAAFFAAGVLHTSNAAPFLEITPAWVPWPDKVVFITGLCEIAGAIGLLVPRTRRLAGVMLALYAVCVFPANIKHAMDDFASGMPFPGWWYHAPRLAFQPVIVWWALYCGGVTRWPFGGGTHAGGSEK